MAAGSVAVEQWSSRWGFFLAAIGFAVGLGNIWRFPFVVGENGGGAFLVIYIIAALLIGLPLLIAELSIGRAGRASTSGSISAVAAAASRSRRWGAVGVLAVFCVFMITTYYTVIAGWTLEYLVRSAAGTFKGISARESGDMFALLMASPGRLIFWNTVVQFAVVLIVARGVQAGIERAVKVLMPVLFAALLAMVAYSFIGGDMPAAIAFLLQPDFSRVSALTVMSAIGQAFFSIGIGMASLIAFGAYLPDEYSIPRSATAIIFADTGVALVAGFAIFPLVFAYGLEPAGGSGLTFVTLPVAFGQMSGGVIFGSVFFVLLLAAALSSCIGCAEAVAFWLTEKFGISRVLAVCCAAAAGWLIGLTTIFSLSAWVDFHPLRFIPAAREMNIYAATDFLAANILLLVGGLLMSVFFGWLVPRSVQQRAIGVGDSALFSLWVLLVRWVIPPVLVVSLIMGIRG